MQGQTFDLSQPLTVKDFGMSAKDIKTLVGDGKAKISVSMGMADKDFGTGFDVHVSVGLTCDQDPEIIGFAYESATDVVEGLIFDAQERAREIWARSQEDK